MFLIISALGTFIDIIFEDLYEWAGKERGINIVKGERVLGGDTVRYADTNSIETEMEAALKELNQVNWEVLDISETAELFSKLIAKIWQIHPFREGNTRTITHLLHNLLKNTVFV